MWLDAALPDSQCCAAPSIPAANGGSLNGRMFRHPERLPVEMPVAVSMAAHVKFQSFLVGGSTHSSKRGAGNSSIGRGFMRAFVDLSFVWPRDR
jgi:hypothetical protein